MKITVEFDDLYEFMTYLNGAIPPYDSEAQQKEAPAAEAQPKKAPAAEVQQKKAPAAEVQQKKAPAAEVQQKKAPAAETVLTATDLKLFAASLAKAGHRKQLKELLTQYGERSVTDLTEHQPERMQDFYDALKEAANAG
jgi:hypothetical protein